MSITEIERIKAVTIAVADQDEALHWYTECLGFVKKADRRAPGFRWVTVAPAGQEDVEFLLASWFPELVGKNATCVVHTRDCAGTYEKLSGRGVEFVHPPRHQPYGVEAVFTDLYGNRYALVQP
jgi:predicted enzyme related to lactoylglutathione lyase